MSNRGLKHVTYEYVLAEYKRGAFMRVVLMGETLLKQRPKDVELLLIVGHASLQVWRLDRKSVV